MSDTMLIRKKGVCTNPDCEMCMMRTVQEIEPGEDFICADCGLPLKEEKSQVKTGGDGGSKLMLYIGIAIIVIAGAAVGWWLATGDKAPEEVVDDTEIEVTTDAPETNIATTPSTETTEGTAESTPDSKEPAGSATTTTTPASAALTVNTTYGTYNGPVKAGKPDGFGGEFKFTRAMTIDLKDGYGTTVDVAPGDKIVSTKFENGNLRQGEIHFADGRRKVITGINQAL